MCLNGHKPEQQYRNEKGAVVCRACADHYHARMRINGNKTTPRKVNNNEHEPR